MIPDDDLELIDLAEVREMTGLSTSTIYSRPDFPAPISLSQPGRQMKRVRWLKSEIRAWLRECIARRDAQADQRRKTLDARRERDRAKRRLREQAKHTEKHIET
jgi:predicted DNA-binding transcriptional regulator AlpA